LPGKTSEKLLRSLFPSEPGDTLSLNHISLFERKLKSTRVFSYIRVRENSDIETSGRSTLTVSGEERIPGEMTLTGFFDSRYRLGTEWGWRHGNLGGQLHEGRLGATFAQLRQSLELGYGSPLFFGTSFRLDNETLMDWYQDGRAVRNLGPYDGDFDVNNSTRLSRPLFQSARFVSSAELVGKSERRGVTGRYRDFSLNYLNSIYWQKMDDLVDPTLGFRLSATWGNGGPFLSRGAIDLFQERHNWFQLKSGVFLPLGSPLTLALRGEGGRFLGEGRLNAQLFYQGGGRSVGSRPYQSVCPENEPVSGRCVLVGIEPPYFLTSLELRTKPFVGLQSSQSGWRHLQGLQWVPFYDFSKVWEVGERVLPGGEGRALGFGFRYGFLSIFNVRLDMAWDPQDPSVWEWVFDLAQAF
jgi:outer membrane translocation and assembly module TamA